MKSRFAFDSSMESHLSEDHSHIYISSTISADRRFHCTRLGVVNPPRSPFVVACAEALHNLRRRLAALMSGPPKGGVQ